MSYKDVPDKTLDELREEDEDNDLNWEAIEELDHHIEVFETAAKECEFIAAWSRKLRDSEITLREYERRVEEYGEENDGWALDEL